MKLTRIFWLFGTNAVIGKIIGETAHAFDHVGAQEKSRADQVDV